MTSREAKRHDLYNVLTEKLGVEETDTLMAYLPTQPHEVLATKADLEAVSAQLGGRIDGLGRELSSLRTEMGHRIDSVNRRLDRLFLTLAAGLLAVVGSVVVQAVL